jgi:hypothetical protein
MVLELQNGSGIEKGLIANGDALISATPLNSFEICHAVKSGMVVMTSS